MNEVRWGALEHDVGAVAGWLAGEGVRPGDRVVVVLGNGADFARAYWGALRAGAVCVPVNPVYTAREITHVLADSGASLVITDAALEPTVSAAAAQVAPAPPVHARLGRGEPTSGKPVDDLAVLCYTSGTTGVPKGARLTHRNLLANLDAFSDLPRLALEPSDVLLGVLPFFHIFGLNVILNAAARAGASVLALERFSPTGTLATMRDHGVTVAYGAPPIFAALNAQHDIPDLPDLRAAVSGAAALPVATFGRFADRFGLEILEGYGLTEAAPVLTTAACSPRVRPGSVGHAVPGVEIRIVDPEGGEVAALEIGEILARGANVFDGYHAHPDATAETVRAGWLHTGDLGALDAEGYLRIAGRLKDLVIVSGFNVYPAEVEAVLRAHPAVVDAAVVGAPDERTGERIRAFVVPRADATVDGNMLLAHCRANLARYKLPRKIKFVEALPRTPLGKLRAADLPVGR